MDQQVLVCNICEFVTGSGKEFFAHTGGHLAGKEVLFLEPTKILHNYMQLSHATGCSIQEMISCPKVLEGDASNQNLISTLSPRQTSPKFQEVSPQSNSSTPRFSVESILGDHKFKEGGFNSQVFQSPPEVFSPPLGLADLERSAQSLIEKIFQNGNDPSFSIIDECRKLGAQMQEVFTPRKMSTMATIGRKQFESFRLPRIGKLAPVDQADLMIRQRLLSGMATQIPPFLLLSKRDRFNVNFTEWVHSSGTQKKRRRMGQKFWSDLKHKLNEETDKQIFQMLANEQQLKFPNFCSICNEILFSFDDYFRHVALHSNQPAQKV